MKLDTSEILQFRPPPRLQDLVDYVYATSRGQKHRLDEFTEPPRKEARKDKLSMDERIVYISKDVSLFHKDWIHIKKVTVTPAKLVNDILFVDKHILQSLKSTKSKINGLEKRALNRARSLANPFELIGKSIFMNRVAVKLANLDSLYQLSKPKLSFVDLCGGPGGFVEYLLWKHKDSKGWGITLHGNQDYDMTKLKDRFTVVYGNDQSGDITVLANINELALSVTQDEKDGVDLVTADGAFSVQGDELYQERHSKQLILCQVLAMFKTLKKGGDFVLKVFDTVEPFTVGLIYILYLHFDKISMIKPLSSRPANSEKYLVSKGLQVSKPQELIGFLEDLVERMYSLKPHLKPPQSAHLAHQPSFIPLEEQVQLELQDIDSVLDPAGILKDEKFADWIDDMNAKYIEMIRYCMSQSKAVKEILAYSQDNKPLPWDQESIAQDCCKKYGIPFIP